MTMPLSDCNEASALSAQQWSAQLSLNMQFFHLLKHCTKILKFLHSRDIHCDGKKHCTVTGAKMYGNFH
jgi:hypothetical protein